MTDSAEEKQHAPSPRRLEQLKKEGNFLRAKEFSSGLSLLAGFTLLMVLSPYFMELMLDNFRIAFSSMELVVHHEALGFALYRQLAIKNFLMILPLGVVLGTVVIGVTFALGGLGFSMSLLKFKGERLNPLKNLRRMVSSHQVVELVKSTIKFLLFMGFFVVFLLEKKADLFRVLASQNADVVSAGFGLIQSFVTMMMFPVILIALFDVVYQYMSYQKKIKMTTQEVKDEQKDMEGRPEVKQRVRQAQREMLRRSIRKMVPQATVVITNPTHYAVALRYDEKEDKAPKILAKGVDKVAAEIRLLAIQNSIPIYEAPQLARAIYFTGKEGTYIHPELYMAVAMVLSYVVQLKHYQRGLANMPNQVRDFDLPKSFQFDD